jgi:hypothetical protein
MYFSCGRRRRIIAPEGDETVVGPSTSILEEQEVGSIAGIFKQSIWNRNRVRIGFSYWPARLHMLAELVPWNRFLGSLKV